MTFASLVGCRSFPIIRLSITNNGLKYIGNGISYETL